MRWGEAQLCHESFQRCFDCYAVCVDGNGNKVVTPVEGIIDENVDKSIINLTSIGSKGMEATDKLVLDIMTGKSC